MTVLTIKDRLRLKLRSLLRTPRGYRTRVWWPIPFGGLPLPTSNGRLQYQVVWQSFPRNYRPVQLPQGSIPEPPGSRALSVPLVSVLNAQGTPYLTVAFCRETGVVSHRDLPDANWLQNYYSTVWDTSAAGTPIPDPAVILRTRPNKVQRILARGGLSIGKRVLDVGCGYGDQLYYFKQCGHVVCGIEPSMHRARCASALLGIDVPSGSVGVAALDRHLKELAGTFDLIYLNQVLEHLVDPLLVLQTLAPYLNNDGLMLIGVPSFFFESMVLFAFSIVHVNSFTPGSLRNIARQAGFEEAVDLSFPGYLYIAFKKRRSDEMLLASARPNVFPVIKRILQQLGPRPRFMPAQGFINSVQTTYTGGFTETAYRIVSSPGPAKIRKVLRETKADDLSGLEKVFPIEFVMPTNDFVAWHH